MGTTGTEEAAVEGLLELDLRWNCVYVSRITVDFLKEKYNAPKAINNAKATKIGIKRLFDLGVGFTPLIGARQSSFETLYGTPCSCITLMSDEIWEA